MRRFIFIAIAVIMLTPATGHAGMKWMQKGSPVTGKAVEVLSGDGSTYVLVENGGQKSWVAVPEMKVSVGEEVSFSRGEEKSSFESKALNRKFDKMMVSPGPAAAQTQPAEVQQDLGVSGKAVEVLHAGGYTYVNTEKEGKKTWVAVPEMKVAVGEEVSFLPGQVLSSFESKSLNRTFDRIVFSGGAVPPETPAKAGKEKGVLSGIVKEVLTSGGYSYVSVERNGNKNWVILPQTRMAVGLKLSFAVGDELYGVENRTLNRKFERVMLSTGLMVPETAAVEKEQAVAVGGKAVEVLHAGGYTYVNVEKDGKKTWVAVPETKVKVGEQVTFQPGYEMPSISSTTLNRTFENIIFSGGLVTPGKKGGKPPAGKVAAGAVGDTKVEKAAGPNAYTIAELFKMKGKLDKKKVTVRGKVVKVSTGIMKRNWIHLQDGTGSKKNKTNDVVVTSEVAPREGDVVTATGTLSKDKDFGAGYKFAVIIEKAELAAD